MLNLMRLNVLSHAYSGTGLNVGLNADLIGLKALSLPMVGLLGFHRPHLGFHLNKEGEQEPPTQAKTPTHGMAHVPPRRP
jgi:hypothetical protein